MFPTGKMALPFQIESSAWPTPIKPRRYPEHRLARLPRDLAAYRDEIETRNIFGLPNNPPQITTSAEPSEFEGRAMWKWVLALESPMKTIN